MGVPRQLTKVLTFSAAASRHRLTRCGQPGATFEMIEKAPWAAHLYGVFPPLALDARPREGQGAQPLDRDGLTALRTDASVSSRRKAERSFLPRREWCRTLQIFTRGSLKSC